MSDAFTADEIRILKSIAAAALGGGSTPRRKGAAEAASDEECFARFGDNEVRRDPKLWAGESFVGRKWSECPPDYLIVLAESLEYFAEKDRQKPDAKKHPKTGKPYWEYNLKDARLIRGWARINGRQQPGVASHGAAPKPSPKPAPAAQYDDFGGADADEIPFAVSHDVGPRHVRRRDRWAKW